MKVEMLFLVNLSPLINELFNAGILKILHFYLKLFDKILHPNKSKDISNPLFNNIKLYSSLYINL